jgi:hypothetical protein
LSTGFIQTLHCLNGSDFGQTEYANKEQCEAERESLRDRVKDVDAEKLPPERYTARTMMRGLNAVQCIASDDPRLKEK